jgi:hypothetical protein
MGKKKKDIIKDALLEAKELEQAAIDNATDVIVESVQPRLADFFKDVLEEGELEIDDEYTDDEEEVEEGTEHDIGKQPGELARDSGAEKEEPEINEEWEAEHGTGPSREAKASKKDGWDKVHDNKFEEDPGENEEKQPGKAMDTKPGGGINKPTAGDPGKTEDSQPGEEVANKNQGGVNPVKAGDPGATEEKQPGALSGRKGLKEIFDDEEEPYDDEEMGDVEDDEDVFDEAEIDVDDEEGDEELDIPDELFSDEEDEEVSDTPEEPHEPEIKVDDPLYNGGDDDIDIDIDMDDDEAGPEMEYPEDDEEDKFEEGLYLRKEGQFVKVSPAEALQTRIGELEEENVNLQRALGALKGQLGESNIFNSKLAHVNKLYMSGLFSSSEKLTIAERMDDCESLEDVKKTYARIVSEARDKNPLDDFNKIISETRHSRDTKTENIYESSEVSRMKRLAGIEK